MWKKNLPSQAQLLAATDAEGAFHQTPAVWGAYAMNAVLFFLFFNTSIRFYGDLTLTNDG